MLSTLLNEMDGIASSASNTPRDGSNQGRMANEILIFAATNRLDCIDNALLRKGRFHHVLFVDKPLLYDAVLLLQYFIAKCKLIQSVDVSESSSRSHTSCAIAGEEVASSADIINQTILDASQRVEIHAIMSKHAEYSHLFERVIAGFDSHHNEDRRLSGAEIENLCREEKLKQIRSGFPAHC